MKAVTLHQLDKRCVKTLHSAGDSDIACAGRYLAFSAGNGFRHVYAAGVGLDDEYFFRKQCAGNIACIGFYEYLGGIAAVKQNIAGGSCDGKPFCGNYIFNEMSPVFPVEVIYLQFTSVKLVFPVDTLTVTPSSQVMDSACTWPVETESVRLLADMLSA